MLLQTSSLPLSDGTSNAYVWNDEEQLQTLDGMQNINQTTRVSIALARFWLAHARCIPYAGGRSYICRIMPRVVPTDYVHYGKYIVVQVGLKYSDPPSCLQRFIYLRITLQVSSQVSPPSLAELVW